MKLLSTLILSLLSITTLIAQPQLGSWQWANKQGGVYNTSSGDNEIVNDICTDKYGNVYVTGIVNESPHFGNVIYTAPFSSFGGDDAFVAKYDKCGNLKWARFGGGTSNDGSTSIHVDDSLNVYMLGYISSNIATFRDSTHIDSISYGGVFWAKYDSVGNLKWAKASKQGYSASELSPISLVTTPSGNLSTIIQMAIGPFYPGFNCTSTHYGRGLFEFDLNGNPIRLSPIDSMVTSTNFSTSFNEIYGIAYDSKGNTIYNLYIVDTTLMFDTVFNNNTSSFGRYFTAKVNHQTNKIIWIKEWKEDQFGESGFGYVLVDNNDNIILDGQGGLDAVFNGDSIKFNSTAATSQEICFKLDSNGNTIWHLVADNTNSANEPVYEGPIALYGDQYICVPINVSGPTYWGGDTFNFHGSTPYVITFINTNTGKVVYGDSVIGSSILNSGFTKLISDEQGNVYVGGDFSANLTAGNTISYTGGINDAFVLKWGLPCPDTDALVTPLAAEGLVASASGAHAIDVTWHDIAQYADRYRVYRSTTDSLTGYTLIDSVSKYTTQYTDVHVVSHQIYWYRVSAVNNAGETYSNSDSAIIAPTGIDELSDIRHIALYPNPANTYTKLSVWSDATSAFSATISITDIAGRESYVQQTEIIQGKNDFVIDISELNMGVYVVNLRGNNESYSKRLILIR